jgi:hypothetical protein
MIEAQAVHSIERYNGASKDEISARIRELDLEWDVERVLEANAASFTVLGVVLGATVDRRWVALSGVVGGFLLQHALQGWCPPLPVFRRLGYRTVEEIDSERYALRFLRGDFDGLSTSLEHGIDSRELYLMTAQY